MSASLDSAAAGTRRAARGGLANLTGAAYSGVAAFAITAMITRIASSTDAGVYFSAISVMTITIALAQIGTPVGYVFLIARYRGLDASDRLRSVLTAGAVPVLAVSSVIITVALIFHNQLGGIIFGENVASAGTIVIIIACVLLIGIAGECSLAATRGLGSMKPTVIVDKFINPTMQLLALLVLAVAGWTGSEELILTRAVGLGVAAVVGIPWLMKLLGRFPTPAEQSFGDTWKPSGATVREFWKFTAPRAIGQFAQVGIQQIDIVLVGVMLSPSDAAIYAAATRFLVFGQLASRSIGLAVQPQISALAAQREFGPLQHLYRTSTAWIIFATWPFYITFIIQADWLMQIFGPEYAPGAIVLRLLSLVMLVATACGAVDAVLLMAGRSDLTMINSWLALGVNLGLNLWLIPKLGIIGATIAWMAAILTNNLLPLIQVRVTIGIHPIGRITILATLVPVVLFGLIPGAVSALDGSLTASIVSVAVCGIGYAALVWRWRETLGMSGVFRQSRRTG